MVTSDAAPAKSAQSNWHRFFWVMAFINLFTVLLSVAVNHRLMTIYDKSVEVNQKWVHRISAYVELVNVASKVNAPGNDVFINHDVKAEAAKMEQACQKFNEMVALRRDELGENLPIEQSAPLEALLKKVETALKGMAAQGTTIFTAIESKNYEAAGERLAEMNQRFAQFNAALTELRNAAREIQTVEFGQQQAAEAALEKLEYVVAVLVVLMIGLATFSAMKMARLHAEEVVRKRAIDELLLKAKEEIAANQAKTEFLSNMSHELRTPLNGIIGMSELLVNSQLTGRQCEYALTVRRSAESLMTILNDILDLSKIEAGKLTLESIPFDLQSIVEEIGQLMSARASEKRLELILHYHQDAPRMLMGDPVRIRQVLSNIVGNAVKFTSNGHILIDVSCTHRDHGSAVLALRVQDTGIGIEASQAEKLFQKFTQADTSTTRRFGGTGLGLAICKNIVEMMQGSIVLDSSVGNGSTFTITLVLPEISEPMPASKELASEGMESLRFLIVDDNEINRAVLTEQLSSWNLRHSAVESGAAALAAMKNGAAEHDPFHVVILDYQMPEMDGLMLAKAIKSDVANAKTVLLMLTSVGQNFNSRDLRKVGISAFLHKPVRQSFLLETLNRVCSIYLGKGPARASGSLSAIPATKSVSSPIPGAESMRVLLVEDNDVNREVALGMLETFGCNTEVAVNGCEAVQIITRGGIDVVLMDCHMPLMDGFEATREVRRIEALDGNGKHIPIIALTASAMKTDRERCLACGMDDYVTKPISMDSLWQALLRFMPEQKRPLNDAECQSDASPEAGKAVFDYNAALKTASGKPERLKRILDVFMLDVPKRLSSLSNALAESDRETAFREAHSLKGAAANVAANRLRDRAYNVEIACQAGSLSLARATLPDLSKDFTEVAEAVRNLS